MRIGGRITCVAGGVLVAAAWIAGVAGIPESYWPVAEVLPELLAVILIVLAWRFRRSRLAIAAVLIALAGHFLRQDAAASVDGTPTALLKALAFLVPANLAVLVVFRDQALQRPLPLIHLAVVAIQPWFAAYLAAVADGSPTADAVDGWSRLLGSPQAALLAYLVAAVFTVMAFALRRGTFEVAMLWVLVASALAILSARGPQHSSLLMAAAQLALLFALVEDSYRLAYHDQLTGLPGRRALDETLGQLDGNYVLAMVDVDHFKKFNDRFGHDVGDQALRMVGDELARVGDGGRSFRYGGEEFTVVLAGRRPAQTWDTLDGLRESIAARSFSIRSPKRPRKKPDAPKKPSKPPERVHLTVSIGAAGPSPRRTETSEVLKAADGALYKAKRRGRNRVVIEGVRAKPKKNVKRKT
jgi:diguanylate cyclase (GGDEF)-like protein